MTRTGEVALSRAFVDLADTLVDDFDFMDFVHSLSRHCVNLFGVDAAGLVLADNTANLRVVGSSSEEGRMLELFEVQNEDGPCFDCYHSAEVVAEADLLASDRWPLFRPEALIAGYRSVFAVPLKLRTEVIGALNLFSGERSWLDHDDLLVCGALADVATIGLLQERTIGEARLVASQLQSALNNRVTIEQAKGVLAERTGIDLGAAFEALRMYARSHRVPVSTVAEDFIARRISPGDLGLPG